MTNRIGKITTAAVVAVATAAMGLGALVAPTAFAAEGNIDSNHKGTLVIHKRAKTLTTVLRPVTAPSRR